MVGDLQPSMAREPVVARDNSESQEIAAGLLEFELNPRNFTRAMRQANRMIAARGMSFGSSHRRAYQLGISMRQRGAIG